MVFLPQYCNSFEEQCFGSKMIEWYDQGSEGLSHVGKKFGIIGNVQRAKKSTQKLKHCHRRNVTSHHFFSFLFNIFTSLKWPFRPHLFLSTLMTPNQLPLQMWQDFWVMNLCIPKGPFQLELQGVHVCEWEEGVEMPIVSCTGLRPDEEGRHAELGGPCWPWFGQ